MEHYTTAFIARKLTRLKHNLSRFWAWLAWHGSTLACPFSLLFVKLINEWKYEWSDQQETWMVRIYLIYLSMTIFPAFIVYVPSNLMFSHVKNKIYWNHFLQQMTIFWQELTMPLTEIVARYLILRWLLFSHSFTRSGWQKFILLLQLITFNLERTYVWKNFSQSLQKFMVIYLGLFVA